MGIYSLTFDSDRIPSHLPEFGATHLAVRTRFPPVHEPQADQLDQVSPLLPQF